MRNAQMIALAVSAVAIADSQSLFAAGSESLNQVNTGTWNLASNWTPNVVPNAVDETAIIGTDLTSATTLTLDALITIGTLSLGDSTTAYFGYTLNDGTGGSLTFQASAGNAVLNRGASPSTATDVINTTTTLNSTLAATVTTGTIQMTGLIGGGGGILRASTGLAAGTGSSGILDITNTANTFTGSTTVQDGVLQIRGSVLSGSNSALGNSTGALVIGNASSTSTATSPELRVMSSDDASNYTISRGIDFTQNVANTRLALVSLASEGTGGLNTNKLTLSGPITLGAVRDPQFTTARTGQTIDFTGTISGSFLASAARSFNLGASAGNSTIDGLSQNGTYRFSNAANTFASNIVLNNGTILIAGNVGAVGTASPIGAGGSTGNGVTLSNGSGGSVLTNGSGGTATTAGVSSIRSVLMESGGTSFARPLSTGGGSAVTLAAKYGGLPVNTINGFRFGYTPTGATNTGSGDVTWGGSITFGLTNIGGSNNASYVSNNTNGNAILVPNNVSLFAPANGAVNFINGIAEAAGGVTSTGTFGAPGTGGGVTVGTATQGTSSASRVNINQFRNSAYIDYSQDGVPDAIAGTPNGAGANEWSGTASTGIVKLSNNGAVAKSYVWTGPTEVRGGTLLVNGTLGSATVGDTITVAVATGAAANIASGATPNAATIGGNGLVAAGKAGSSLVVNGTVAPGDSTDGFTTGKLTVDKPITFAANSTLSLLLDGTSAGAASLTGYDQLASSNNTAPTISATGTLLSVALGFAPADNTSFTVIDNTGTGFFTSAFSNLAEGGSLSATFGANTYTLTGTYLGGTGNDLVLTSTLVGVPEPTGIAAGAAVMGVFLRRRNRSTRA